MDRLKVIFKEYWDRGAKWVKFATKESISEWEGEQYKGMLSISSGGKIQHIDGTKYNGITNPVNGKVLISKSLSNYGLASTFIHEMVHSIDVVSGVQGFWNNFSIGHDYIESRAYLEVAKWQGSVFSEVGKMHIINAMPVILSQFNFIK